MEAREKTPRKTLTESEEPSKSQDPDAKILKREAFKTSPPENSRENGPGVSLNGKEEDFGDDLDDNDEVSLEDSEMNGVCSLLKMQESGGLHGLGSVLEVIDENERRGIESDNDDDDDDDDGVSQAVDISKSNKNKGYSDGKIGELSGRKRREVEKDVGDGGSGGFRVGDFVWGKIRSHPWWPGRIYDPLDASDFAKKVRQRDGILVAYFGDGTFAWCNSSQLKPFEENFAEMSKQSGSKNFVNAVEKAVDEVGRLVDLKMTCSCVPKDNLIGFGRSLAVNAGIKDGLLVPEGGIEKFSNALFEPTEVLGALKGIAGVATITNMLEVAILKNWLSAFYRTKGGFQLPFYYEPQPIPGLDDETRNWVVDVSNYSGGVVIQGPVEEDWLSSPRCTKFGQTSQSSLQKCQSVSEDRLYLRRKQKSIAEIIGELTDAAAENKEDDVAKEETKSSKLASSVKRRKRKGSGEIMTVDIDAEGKKEAVDMAKEGANSGRLASLSGRKKKKGSSDTDSEGKNKVGDVDKAGTVSGKLVSSSGIKRRRVSDEAEVDGINDSISKSRRRKEARHSESVVAEENKVSGLDGSGVKKESGKRRSMKKKGNSTAEDDDVEGKKEETSDNTMSAEKKMDGGLSAPSNNSGEAEEQIEKDSLSRERKKSKYLSPPYTNLNRGRRKKEMEAESMKVSSEAQLGERMTKAAGHLVGSPPILKSRGESFQKKPSKEPGVRHEKLNNSNCQTAEQDQSNTIDPVKVKAPANEVLSQIRTAALNPLHLKDSNSLDMVGGFLSAFRSSIYCNGPNFKIYNKRQSGKKRKSLESEAGSLVKEQNQAEHSSQSHKSQRKKSKRSLEAKSDKSNGKQAAIAPDVKANDKESDGKAPAAALFVAFGPGSSLPSKNDLINLYGKYGALNKEETEMLYQNHCARIVFLNTSEAEEAFNSSQLDSPFGAASVTFRLQYLSAETKTRELKEISSAKPSPLVKEGAKIQDKSSASKSTATNLSQLEYVRQKLELLTSMLEMSDGKMSPSVKSKLESEIKGLLEKVSTMVGPSS